MLGIKLNPRQFLDRVPESEEIRVWIAACATGEEAYSIAILLAVRVLPPLQVAPTPEPLASSCITAVVSVVCTHRPCRSSRTSKSGRR